MVQLTMLNNRDRDQHQIASMNQTTKNILELNKQIKVFPWNYHRSLEEISTIVLAKQRLANN